MADLRDYQLTIRSSNREVGSVNDYTVRIGTFLPFGHRKFECTFVGACFEGAAVAMRDEAANLVRAVSVSVGFPLIDEYYDTAAANLFVVASAIVSGATSPFETYHRRTFTTGNLNGATVRVLVRSITGSVTTNVPNHILHFTLRAIDD